MLINKYTAQVYSDIKDLLAIHFDHMYFHMTLVDPKEQSNIDFALCSYDRVVHYRFGKYVFVDEDMIDENDTARGIHHCPLTVLRGILSIIPSFTDYYRDVCQFEQDIKTLEAEEISHLIEAYCEYICDLLSDEEEEVGRDETRPF